MNSTFRAHEPARPDWLAGGGEMGRRVRAFDWSTTPIGARGRWPHGLRAAVGILLHSQYPMFVWWGRGLTNIYNDAYAPMLGARHPEALGQSAPHIWADIWPVVGPQTEQVFNEGRATWNESVLLVMERHGYVEETYFTFSYSPIPGDRGGVAGLFCAVTEETKRVLGERRLKTLRDLGERSLNANTAAAACRAAADTIAANPHDFPFALIYLLDDEGTRAVLANAINLPAGTMASPPTIVSGGPDDVWGFQHVIDSRQSQAIDDLHTRFGRLPAGPWNDDETRRALVVPLAKAGAADRPAGFLVAGISPRLIFSRDYRSFVELAAGHLGTAVANALAYEQERQRAEALAALDRAKTEFFSNVSHEFRTPLTLLLGPIEDVLAQPAGGLSDGGRAQIETAHRNGLRLLKLVNTLLDFSRIQAGRIEASYEPTDLAAATADLASLFRSAIERAGLTLIVESPPLPEPVYVDRDMWEKIVLNLLSNALKFTFDGRIEVAVRWCRERVELRVSDTGVGIPGAELTKVFDRFHRVRHARARTQEGTGIGLALVRDLARLHGGDATVDSMEGTGSTFVVTVKTGTAHLPPDHLRAVRPADRTTIGAAPYVEEALRWTPDAERETANRTPGLISAIDAVDVPRASAPGNRPGRSRIVWVDDNADMRDYVARLLAPTCDVEALADGTSALAAARRRPPDLVLADVMMPGLGGFDLLRALREEPSTADVPVILLSARAGEESRVEGVASGADDYLVKPFTARELLARVEAHVKLSRLRREAAAAHRRSEEQLRAADRRKDEFLAMLAHELRNPLAPIRTGLEVIRLAGDTPGAIERVRTIIERQVGHMVRLIDDLLDVSRITSGTIRLRREPAALDRLVDTALEAHRTAIAAKRLVLAVDLPATLCVLDVDPTRFVQILSNVLHNATKFTDVDGSIRLSARVNEDAAVPRELTISVEDSGIGMSPELLPRVFDLFAQGDRDAPQSGLGIGLTLARRLVEMHGGRIEARSAGPGRGSEIVIHLPLSAETPRGRATERLRPPRVDCRVVVIDDNRDAATVMAMLIGELGGECRTAYDGEGGLREVLRDRPDVVLLDIGMPGIDGYETCRRIRAALGHTVTVVAVTGFGQAQDKARATEAGFDTHLTKPADPEALEALLRRCGSAGQSGVKRTAGPE